jgi:hypothetical protein
LKNFRQVPGTFWAGLFFLAALLFTACKSVPKTANALLSERLPLEGGASVYLFMDVAEARQILGQIPIEGLSSADAAQALDRTRYAVAALYPPESGRKFQAVAWGNYPSFFAGLNFTPKKGWQKQKSQNGKSYWFSANRGLSLALGGSQAFLAGAVDVPGGAAAGGAAGPQQRRAADPYNQGAGVDIPPDFTLFRGDSPLALWMEEPAGPLARFFSGLGLPLQIPAEELMASLTTLSPAPAGAAVDAGVAAGPGGSGALYEIRLRIKTPGASNARSLATLFAYARLFLPQGGGEGDGLDLLSLLFARTPEQDGQYLNLRTAPLTEQGVALLFKLFSVYSSQN